jgi:hypothetical protein
MGVLAGPGTALAEPALSPSTGEVAFGPVDIHFGGSPKQSVQFTNGSLSPVNVSSVTLGGAESSRFQIVGDGCSGRTIESNLNPGSDSCTVEVSFEPGVRGAANATLELLAEGETLSVPLTGEGITGTLSGQPSTVGFTAVPYIRQNEGGESETEQVTILDGSAGTRVESVSITGPDASSFSVRYGDCEGALLGSGNTCDVGVGFQPVSLGEKHAELVIESDSESGPLTIPLEGEGLHGAKVSLSSYQALLGEVPLGSSVSQTFTLTNSGDYPLGVQQDFLVSGTPLMFPVSSDTCSGHVIYPNGTCEVTVGFEPTTLGEKDASVIFITSASPVSVVGIDGVGVPVASSAGAASPQALGGQSSSLGSILPGALPSATRPGRTGPVAKHSSDGSELLKLSRPPRLYAASGAETLETGVRASCPGSLHPCSAESFLTASIRRGGPEKAHESAHTMVLLGARTIHLKGGTSARVQVPLSEGAISLLRVRGRLRATIEIAIRAGGRTVATRTRSVTLLSLS